MPSRRHFLAGAGAAMTRCALGSSPRGAAPDKARANRETWLTYAVNVEMTWGNLPFLDRLRKVKEAGFTHYEFWPWRNKDIDAIVALNHELGLTPVQFSASPVKGFGHGITSPDPARRDEFEEEIRSAVPVAKKLGVKKICVVAGEETKGYSREEQTQAVIAALKAGAKIVDRAPLLGREAWTIEGIVQPDLKRAIIYFGTARTLVEVELQYESPEWDLIAYEEFLNSARQRLEAKYGPPVVLARDKGPKVT